MQNAGLGRELLLRLVADRKAANFRAGVVRTAVQLLELGLSGMQSLLVVFLDYYSALAGLLGRQPSIKQVKPDSTQQMPEKGSQHFVFHVLPALLCSF